MKEKDIVNFDEMQKDENGDHIDNNGNVIGCHICYTHEKAYEKFENMPFTNTPVSAVCPNCGEHYMIPYELQVVSEVNYSNPDGEIGYYSVFNCDKCGKYFAYIPHEISYNGNHDIFYTGGRDYLENDEHIKLKKQIFDAIKPSIEQYIRRVVDEHERYLDINNILTWCGRDVEHTIANWLYEHNLKK